MIDEADNDDIISMNLDGEWIHETEKHILQKEAEFVKPMPNETIKINVIYLNKNKVVERIEKFIQILSVPGFISKSVIMKIIQSRQTSLYNPRLFYELESILVYNIDISSEPQIISKFIKNNSPSLYNYLSALDFMAIDEGITIKPTPSFLKTLNSMYVILQGQE